MVKTEIPTTIYSRQDCEERCFIQSAKIKFPTFLPGDSASALNLPSIIHSHEFMKTIPMPHY